MKKFAKVVAIAVACAAVTGAVTAFTACGPAGGVSTSITTAIARTAGSGTRGAFDELVVNSEGEALEDHIADADWILTAETTGQVVTQVGNNSAFLGYISMGSVEANTNKIKAIKVNGVEPTVAEVNAGNYELSRPFNLLFNNYDELSDAAKNFISYMFSEEGAEIINSEWISVEKPANVAEYSAYAGAEDEVNLFGSTSLQPMIAKLAEAYEEANPSVDVTWGGTGSGTAAPAVIEGTADIGMISREQATSGDEAGLSAMQVAIDGIAVVVHKDSALSNVTFDQLFDLYVEGTVIPCE